MSMTQLDSGAGGGARNTRGRTPVWGPRLNGEDLDISVTEIAVTMTEGQHDATIMSCVSSTLENTEDMLDMPFSFYFGVPPNTELLQGYITDISNEQGSQGSLSFSMTILGATKAMFDGSPHFWAGRSVTSATNELVTSNWLGFGGHPHTFLWPALAQTEESDWEMTVKLAKKAGWSVFSRYGVVLLYDPNKLFRETGSYTRLVSNNTDLGSTDRNLIEFQASEFSKMTQDNLGARIGYFNDNDVRTIEQPGEFKGYTQETEIVLTSQPEAQAVIDGLNVRLDSWAENGVARVWGDADLFPGQCVDVVTTREKYVYTKYDGKWLIRGVGHKADNQSFQTVLYLTRPDPDDYPPMTVSYRPFWEEEVPPRTRPSLSIYEEQWRSSWERVG